MIAVFDTETTGVPLWKEPSEREDQPHMIQLSALLIDPATQEEVEVLDLIIKPDGWSWNMDDEAARVHGITMEYALEHGVDEKWAVEQFLELVDQADLRVAHGEPFDARLIRIALKRYGIRGQHYLDTVWKEMARECTARMATKIVDLPPSDKMKAKNMNRPKPPKMEEAYPFFFGEKLEGAHDGLVDARGCARVYFEILRRQGEPA